MIKNPKLKEHIKSAITTFLTMFILTLLISIQDISLESVKDGTLVGIITAAFRAGIKALIPLFQSLIPQSK